jgi:hypothetical protein
MAVVLLAKRRRDGAVRIKVQWLESNEKAGVYGSHPIVAGQVGWVIHEQKPGAPQLIKQIDRGAPLS